MKNYVLTESTVNFRIKDILCKVTYEYLTDVNPNTYSLGNEQKFLQNRSKVEISARQKILNKQFENDRSILLSSNDL
jgi:hypothetical protein